MKHSSSRLVGIADFRPTSKSLALFDSDGRRVATEGIRLHEIGTLDRSGLVEAVSALIKETTPRLCGLMIIVSTTEAKHPRVERIAIDPVPVSIVPEILAVADAVPDSWSSFQVIDNRSRILSLIEKEDGEVHTVRSALFSQLGPMREIVDQFAAMGYVNAAVLGEADPISRALLLDAEAVFSGAHRIWQRQGSTEGVHVCVDQRGREILQVDAGQRIRYRIVHIDQPVFSLEEDALAEFVERRPVLFVVDEKVNAVYSEPLDLYARERLNCVGKIVISGSEDRKTWSQVDWICREAARLRFARHGVLISVGGGVALDVAGFAASVFRRGINYLRVPTSLIGLIDAGLGIKQGVNFAEKKNLLGAFYPPMGTINDPSFLTTLSVRDLSCGIAEVIKIALIRDGRLFELLEEHGKELLESRFARPAQVARRLLRMAEILMLGELQPNLYETNLVRLVDFGHTFSPVIETQSGYKIAHGEAVALDMLLSTAIAVDRGLCDDELFHRMVKLYKQVLLPAGPMPCSAEQLALALDATRLHRGGNLNLVVPERAGRATFLQDVESSDIQTAMAHLYGASCRNLRVGYGVGV